MKKMKKLLAVLLAVTTMLAMSLTTFAQTVTIQENSNGALEGAALKYVQVIEPDTKTVTGWKFKTGEAEFKTAFRVDDGQKAIAMLIKKENASAPIHASLGDIKAATQTQIDTALANLTITDAFTNGSDLTTPGLYAIRAEKTGYTYKTMAVYVAFEGETTPENITVKGSKTQIVKAITGNTTNQAVAIGDTVSYSITSYVPYIPVGTTDKFYRITDTIGGANFNQNSVRVTLGGDDITTSLAGNIQYSNENKTITVTLNSYLTDDNQYASKPVVITYDATVTELQVDNTVNHEWNDGSGSDTTHHYTGKITLTKKDATNTNTKLAGAGFNVTKDSNSTPLTFKPDVTGQDGKYTYAASGTDLVTEVKTGADGTLEVKGLDTGDYTFTEITAPAGYSVNQTPATATLTVQDTTNNVATAIFTATTEMTDTKLNALPSTGGMGTTLFTIAGIVVMVGAVALFFASRKKNA